MNRRYVQTPHAKTAPPGPEDFVAFTVRIPRKLVKKLDKDAKEARRSRTAQVEGIVEEYYKALRYANHQVQKV